MGVERHNDRGVTEFAGVAILVSMTVLVTASVGLFVLVGDLTPNEEPNANFTFQYIEQSSSMIITFDRGTEMKAGNLTVRGKDAEATWDQLAGTNKSELIGPGDTIQISPRNAYNESVTARSKISVTYTNETGNETVLQRWKGP